MIKITCYASDCEKEFTKKFPHSKFCSDACRYRSHKRQKYEERKKEGLCPQCGGAMVGDNSRSYCEKCKEYFKLNYYKNKSI